MKDVFIVSVNEDNFSKYTEIICPIKPKHRAYPLKIEWLKKRFKEGLK